MSEDKKPSEQHIIGHLKEEHIELLGLSFIPSPIFIGTTNVDHMRSEHPEDFEKYYKKLSEIVNKPDYIGKHPSKGSIEYIKKFDEHVLVAVRISGGGKLFVRSLYKINVEKLTKYIESGTTLKIES